MNNISLFLCVIFLTNQAYAHHSPRAVFVSEQIQVEGVVSRQCGHSVGERSR